MHSYQPPIDIHCSKLVDWLVQRRHCMKDWGENLAVIRRKIRVALGDMPETEEMKSLLLGSKLDYFKSKQIVQVLKTTESSSKNIFGHYSSQRMKDWQDIVNSYERDNVYLAEISTDLIRETNYEIPETKKTITKLSRQKEDLEKERSNLLRKSQQFLSELNKLAQSYGIKGENVTQELAEKSRDSYAVMEEIEELCKELKAAVEYYREFAKGTSKQDADKFVYMLNYVITSGNTTVYEWKHGQAPEGIEKVSNTDTHHSSEIEMVGDDEIDFGEDLPSSESSSGFVHVGKVSEGNGDIEETFIKLDGSDSKVLCYASNDKTARGDDAKLVLELRKPRELFFNNLYELDAFYSQTLADLTTGVNRSSSFSVDGCTRVHQCDGNQINKILSQIRQIFGIMSKDKNKILFQMKDSQCFVENVEEKFVKKAKQASDCKLKADLLVEDIKDLENRGKEIEVQLKKSISSAKDLKEKVETSLSAMYQNRTINIMGCVS